MGYVCVSFLVDNCMFIYVRRSVDEGGDGREGALPMQWDVQAGQKMTVVTLTVLQDWKVPDVLRELSTQCILLDCFKPRASPAPELIFGVSFLVLGERERARFTANGEWANSERACQTYTGHTYSTVRCTSVVIRRAEEVARKKRTSCWRIFAVKKLGRSQFELSARLLLAPFLDSLNRKADSQVSKRLSDADECMPRRRAR